MNPGALLRRLVRPAFLGDPAQGADLLRARARPRGGGLARARFLLHPCCCTWIPRQMIVDSWRGFAELPGGGDQAQAGRSLVQDGSGERICGSSQRLPQGANGADGRRATFGADLALPQPRPCAGELRLGADQAVLSARAAHGQVLWHKHLMGISQGRMTEVMSLTFGEESLRSLSVPMPDWPKKKWACGSRVMVTRKPWRRPVGLPVAGRHLQLMRGGTDKMCLPVAMGVTAGGERRRPAVADTASESTECREWVLSERTRRDRRSPTAPTACPSSWPSSTALPRAGCRSMPPTPRVGLLDHPQPHRDS